MRSRPGALPILLSNKHAGWHFQTASVSASAAANTLESAMKEGKKQKLPAGAPQSAISISVKYVLVKGVDERPFKRSAFL